MKSFKKMCLNLCNEKGFSLVEVLIASGMLGLVSLGVMELSSQQSKLSSKGNIDGDLAQVNAQILSYLANPGHCNANFYSLPGKANGTSFPIPGASIKVCPPNFFCNGDTAGTPKIPVLATAGTTPTDWLQTTTGISDRIRITSANFLVNKDMGGGLALGSLELTVTFQLRPKNNYVASDFKTVIKKFNTSVVLTNTKIEGCPRTWNSTVVYGL